jgi:hypothetical protein
MSERQTVAVLMGGTSPEREVSLASGEMVAEGLRSVGFDVVEIKIAADGRWWKEGKSPNRRSLPSSVLQALDPLPGVVFIALHGGNGEDGTVQGMLELLGLPYTGSGVLASSLPAPCCIDEEKSQTFFSGRRFPGWGSPWWSSPIIAAPRSGSGFVVTGRLWWKVCMKLPSFLEGRCWKSICPAWN